MILLALHLHSLQVGIEFEGQMTLKGTEASAPDVPPDEGVRREPQKGRLPNGRTTGPAHRSSKGNWTAEEGSIRTLGHKKRKSSSSMLIKPMETK